MVREEDINLFSKPKKKIKARGKDKGNGYEVGIMNELLKWFKDCLTSRYASRYMDDKKVDLVNTENLYFQLKAVESYLNYYSILDSMLDDKYHCKILLHKIDGRKNIKNELIAIYRDEFVKFFPDYDLSGFTSIKKNFKGNLHKHFKKGLCRFLYVNPLGDLVVFEKNVFYKDILDRYYL